MTPAADLVSHIEANSHPEPNSGCWLWVAATFRGGYGSTLAGARGVAGRAHRLSWIAYHGAIPAGMCVLHRCDNPPCVNPAHLWLGSQADNMRDKVAKNRQSKGDSSGARTRPDRLPRGERHGSRTHPERVPRGDRHSSRTRPEAIPRGEGHWNAKLTPDAVRAIRADSRTQDAIAASYGIGRATVSRIKNGKGWGHVQ